MEELIYSIEDAAINRAMFFLDFDNPIVFVEDKDKEFWYQTILRRIFNDKFFEINSCGGKTKVEDAYKKLLNVEKKAKCIYLCDGDFDNLIDRKRIIDSSFIYLKKYEIENYVVDEKSLLSFLIGRIYGSYENAQKILNYATWYNNIIEDWYELMVYYIIAQRNEIECVENCGIGSERYFCEDTCTINKSVINEYKNKLIIELNNVGKDIEMEIKIVEEKIKEAKIDKNDIIKGKYILVSAIKYIKEILKRQKKGTFTVNDDVFNLLLNTFDISSLDYVKERIEQILVA